MYSSGEGTAACDRGSVTDYPWDVASGLPVVISDTNDVYLYGLDLISRQDVPSGTLQYYHSDALGSVRNLTDASGAIIGSASYDAFGALRTGTVSGDFQFTGQESDPETGLYFLRARYYDPMLGRFTTRDTWSGDTTSPYSLNPYLYVEDNPMNLIDPSGLFSLANCAEGDLGLAVYGFVSICPMVTTDKGDIGGTLTFGGGGTTGFKAGAGIGPQFSNANKVGDLGKWFATGGGSFRLLAGVALDAFAGRNSCGQTIWGGSLMPSEGLNVSLLGITPGPEVHGGNSYTLTWQYPRWAAYAGAVAPLLPGLGPLIGPLTIAYFQPK